MTLISLIGRTVYLFGWDLRKFRLDTFMSANSSYNKWNGVAALRKNFFLPFSKFIEQRQEHGKHEGFFLAHYVFWVSPACFACQRNANKIFRRFCDITDGVAYQYTNSSCLTINLNRKKTVAHLMTHESMLRAYSELEDQIAKLFTTDVETEQLVLKIYSNSVILPISEYGRLWESAMQIRPVKPHGESHHL